MLFESVRNQDSDVRIRNLGVCPCNHGEQENGRTGLGLRHIPYTETEREENLKHTTYPTKLPIQCKYLTPLPFGENVPKQFNDRGRDVLPLH